MKEPSSNTSWYTSETARVYGSIPGSLPNNRAYRDRFVPDRLPPPRGGNIPWRAAARCIRSLRRAARGARHAPPPAPRGVARVGGGGWELGNGAGPPPPPPPANAGGKAIR